MASNTKYNTVTEVEIKSGTILSASIIGQDGETVTVSDGGNNSLNVRSLQLEDLLSLVLIELKKINFQLAEINDEELTDVDVELEI